MQAGVDRSWVEGLDRRGGWTGAERGRAGSVAVHAVLSAETAMRAANIIYIMRKARSASRRGLRGLCMGLAAALDRLLLALRLPQQG